jgi:fructokinase
VISPLRIGVDVGGTKIEAVALDGRDRELSRERVRTPSGDYERTLGAIVHLVRLVESQAGGTGTVGVGIPGTLSPATGVVKNANSTWLIGRPLGDDLPRLLGRPVRFANDANCLALSESTDGAAAGAPIVFGVVVGSGTGGGVVVNGQVVTGANAIAGEWGHNPMPWPREGEWPGPACYCGRTGCIETFLSGPGLARDYRATAGEEVAASDVVARAAAGERAADACLARYEERMARALASVINVLDPDVIVLGGGLSNVDRWYASVPALWSRWIFSDAVATRLLRAKHGDSSGVRGAAYLWPCRPASVRADGSPQR